MDRKSARKRNSPGGRNRYCCICSAAALGLAILAGCACLQYEDRCRPKNPALAEARVYLLEGDKDLAIEALKEEMANGTERCTAAFYLFFLDPSSSDYLEVLNTPACITRYPLNGSVIQRYLALTREMEKCTKKRRVIRKKISVLSAQLKNEKKEKERLRFELKKLEQIRRETENLRLKK